MLRRGDNLHHITTRQLRLQPNNGSSLSINGIPRIADSNGTVAISAATLTANGSAHLPGTLIVEEGAAMNGSLVVNGATNINGSVDIGGKLTCTGITSTGVAIFNTNVVIQGDTIIEGPTQIVGDSTIQNLTINNEFITEGPVIINNNTTINGPTTFNDNIIINNDTTINAPVEFNDTVTFNGKVEIPNDLTADRLHIMKYMDDVTNVTSINTDLVRAKGVLVEADDMSYTLTAGKVVDISGNVLIRNGNLELLDPSGGVILSSDKLNLSRITGEKVTLSGAGLKLTDATSFSGSLTLDSKTVTLSADVSNGTVSIETLEGGQIRLKDHSVGVNKIPSADFSIDVSGDVFISAGARAEYLIMNPQAAPVAPQLDVSMNPVDEILFPKSTYAAMWMDVSNNVWVGDHKIQMQHEIQVGSWFDKYLLAQPAAPTDPSNNETSAEVLIWWEKNPAQIDASFMQQMLPRIAQLRVDFIGTNGTMLSVSNTDQLPGTVSAATAVRGIALVKGNGTSNVGSRTVNGSNVPVYVHYLGAGIQPPAQPFDARIWYEGYGDKTRVEALEVKGLRFSASSGPSITRVISASAITYNGVKIGYQIPEYSDAVAQLVPRDGNYPANPAIVTYDATLTPTSSRRYGSAYNTLALTNTLSEPTRSVDFTGLFPDTTYSISVYATNSTGDTGIPGTGSFLTSLQPNLAPNLFIDALILSTFFPTSQYTTSIYSNGTPLVHPVLYSLTGKITGASIGPLSIHVDNTRGSSYDDIMSLSSSTTSLSVGGFGKGPKSVDNAATGIKISEDVNSRSDPGSNETAGFYQTAKYTVELTVTPGLLNTLTMTQSFSDTAKTNSFTFYTDDLDPGAVPVVSGIFATRLSGTTRIAGIPISNSEWTLNSIGFSATNMGKYFHTTNPVTYSFANTSTTTLLSSLPANRSDSAYTASGLTISGTATSYAYQPVLSITAENTGGALGRGSLTFESILFDPASLAKARAVKRIQSPTDFMSTTYNTVGFNDTTVAASYECILANGYFAANSFQVGGQAVFRDYSAINGDPNLSSPGVVGYRYITLQFGGALAAASKNRGTITLTFSDNVSIGINGAANIITFNNNTIQVYYRAGNGGNKQTKWINANSKENNNFTDSNIYGISSTTAIGGQSSLSISGRTAIFSVLLPNPVDAGNMYISVGIPNNINLGIDTISWSFS